MRFRNQNGSNDRTLRVECRRVRSPSVAVLGLLDSRAADDVLSREDTDPNSEIGRASCRERVEVSVGGVGVNNRSKAGGADRSVAVRTHQDKPGLTQPKVADGAHKNTA